MISLCPSLGGRNLKCHVCAHRERTAMAQTESGTSLWRYNQIWANIFHKPMMRDAGMWGDDLYVTLWHHHDPALTPLWHHTDLFLTLLCEQCGHTHSALQSNKEVDLSSPVGGVLGERRDQAHFDPHPRILSLYPPHLLWVRFSWSCDLYTWPVSSQLSWPFDHILTSHMTTPSPRGLWWRRLGVPYTTRKPSDSTCTLIYVFFRWIDEKKTFLSLILMTLFFAALKPEEGFSFIWISCFPWLRLDVIEDQYKQSTHAVNTHSNLSPRLWTGSL